ncbi:hypothetical protein Tco_0700336 [Tanacetum coccineum]
MILLPRFLLAPIVSPRKTENSGHDIQMFQQHHEESLSEAWTRFKTYYKKSLIPWASTFGSKSKFFMTMSFPSQDEIIDQSLTNRPVYCMEDLEQAFVKYASSRTDEAGDARLSKFEADFKQQQSEMTNKIDIVLKAITDRIASTLPSDTVKNPKLCTFPVLSARSYLTIDPQCLSHASISINAIKAHSKEANISQTSLPQTRMGIKTQQLEEPEPTLQDEL